MSTCPRCGAPDTHLDGGAIVLHMCPADLLRRDYRDERIRRYKWQAAADILSLAGIALVTGFAVYAVFMALGGA